MKEETTQLMIDPDNGEKPAFGGTSNSNVIRHVPPDLRGLNPLSVVQRLFIKRSST